MIGICEDSQLHLSVGQVTESIAKTYLCKRQVSPHEVSSQVPCPGEPEYSKPFGLRAPVLKVASKPRAYRELT